MVVRVWFAVDTSLDNSPPMARWRIEAGALADAYYYRALAFAKLYSDRGLLANLWEAVAGFVRWPESHVELRDAWRRCGLVEGDGDLLYQWDGTNGWILAKRAREKKRAEQNRKAARIGQQKRRAAKRAAAGAAAKGIKSGRLVGR